MTKAGNCVPCGRYHDAGEKCVRSPSRKQVATALLGLLDALERRYMRGEITLAYFNQGVNDVAEIALLTFGRDGALEFMVERQPVPVAR